jgi:plasmid stabilization system protein ParE
LKIIRGEQFKEELKTVVSFIAKDKRTAAKKFNRALQTAIDSLIDHPRKGRPTEDGNRELIHKGYTIPYLIDDENIIILGIFNQNEWSREGD